MIELPRESICTISSLLDKAPSNGEERTMGYEKLKKFIAAQGPTEYTINDFWKMVWQEDVSTVVMLTGLVEIGHIKCMQYWPDEDQETYGNLKVSIKVCEELADYIVRTLELTKDGYEPRLVRQYHFKAWPDKTVPDTAWSLVQFWRAVMSRSSTNNRPIIVHCSAGVGRTGTFIALDNLYHQAAEEGSLRPLQMIENLRRQRVNMVQTKDQYVFLHEAVAEAFYFGTYSVFLNQFEEWYNFMNREDMNSDKSRLAKQYELLEKSATEVYTKSEDATEAVYANTTENVLHCDTLAPDGEQSWNPLEIEAYNRKKCFIVCTTPIADAKAKYSQLIKEKHIKTAVLISEKEENSLKGQYDEENVKVFVFEWKSDSPLPLTMESFLEKLDSLQNWQSFPNNTQPILVHCRSILTNCMTVCIVLGEMQRVKLDGAVNILESTKIASGNTKALLPSFEQYRFCHELILKTCCQQPDVYANVSTKRTT